MCVISAVISLPTRTVWACEQTVRFH